MEELDYEEISEILKRPINTIRANVARARKKILMYFKEDEYGMAE
ncbi:hypothetical protein EMN47_05140 [Prolixibacteraceae bacterium JC049]|nr:hypothetical protein [Prolixibacteraceae bacterium JC049]